MTFCLSSCEAIADPDRLEAVSVRSEKAEGNQHRIIATIQVPYPIEQVWHVLTDYEAMPEFIPNLVASRRLEESNSTNRIEQIGAASLLNIRLTIRVVLEMMEKFPHQIDFQMIEGDFKAFSGRCELDASPYKCGTKTDLYYAVQVQPKLTMPIAILEKQLRHDLPLNLLAIERRLDTLFGRKAC
ncbi:SRPBCC family protein [Tumidithrix helvetica PCC 7403]|uniref:SRPBCC family protein n=1 Tax=Tumidithrix helvetica TaxID=3457545 RepID=UPI003CC233AA